VLASSGGWYKVSTSRGTGWVASRYFQTGSASGYVSQPAPSRGGVTSIARQYVGYPYRYGAVGPNAFDCSGFTQYVYRRAGISIPRTAAAQYSSTPGTRIRSYSALQPGDLIFFANTYKPGISHVGIYVGNGQMIHAGSSRTGVAYANINGSYYTSRFAGGVRP
jgi:cell wall-associated NlpC family hydrolase